MKSHVCKKSNAYLVNPCCEAGVNYRELVGGEDFGWLRRIPCNTKNKTDVKCDLLELPTAEEVAESEKETDRFLEMMRASGPIIAEMKEKYAESGGSEVVECPMCQGKLHVSISSYNGHSHGRCETENCLRWME